VSIVKTPEGLYRSTLLSELAWVSHAFGTAAAHPRPGYLLLHQIHSASVLEARDCAPGVDGDALVTREPGVAVAVKTADCVPLLIADPVTGAVAAVHAGWRGTLSNIAAAAVARLADLYGSRPADLIAALGPSIGLCCFEIGPEVAPEFRPLFPKRTDLDRQTKVDLREANRRQLVAAGLAPARIDDKPPCTYCGGPEFYSWRRDRQTGQRMFSVIAAG
jgi:polyphenol oxidase